MSDEQTDARDVAGQIAGGHWTDDRDKIRTIASDATDGQLIPTAHGGIKFVGISDKGEAASGLHPVG